MMPALPRPTYAAVVLVAVIAATATAWAGLGVGDRAPAVRVQTAGAGTLDTRSLRGRVVVLNFWAEWCRPCAQEAPVLVDAARRLRARGGMLVGLGDGFASLADATRAARGFGMTYPVGLATPETMRRYGVSALPFTVVIGRDGRVAATFEGSVTEAGLDAALASALGRR